MTRIGEMDKKVTIQAPTETDDGGGQYVPSWSTFATVWARIADPSPYQIVSAEKVGQRITHTITIWYLSGVTQAMRIKYGSRYLYIQTVNNVDEASEFLLITAEEKL